MALEMPSSNFMGREFPRHEPSGSRRLPAIRIDPASMKGKSVWVLFPELKGTTVERELRHVIEDHAQVSYEFFYPKDQRWYETKGYPASPGAILVFRDITAKKNSAQSS